jgi:uncharacterized protein YPO0396
MPPSQISNAVLLEKINNVLKEVGDMAGDIKCNANDFAKFANEYAGAHVKVVERADNAHSRIDELNKRVDALDAAMKKLTDSIHPLIYTNKVLTWLAIGFGGSVIALIWAILTHAVEIVAP